MPGHNESESSSPRTGTLCLSRREGERILIGDNVVIEVTKIRGNQVALAINAPKDTPVHREEIYNRIKSGAKAPR